MESIEIMYTEGAARMLREMGPEVQESFQEHIEKFATEYIWRQPEATRSLGQTHQGRWGGGISFRSLLAVDQGVKMLIVTALKRM